MDLMVFIRDSVVIIGVCVTIYNINSWRREHIGKRKIELAEDTLTLFYEAADIIQYLRSPLSLASETEEIEKRDNESDGEYQARKRASILFKRYNEHQEIFSRIHAVRYRFMAQIGKEEAKPFDDLREITNDLFSAARRLSRLWAQKGFRTNEQILKHQQDVEKYEAIFWADYSDNDPIKDRVKKVIENIEKVCNKIIRE